MKASELRIGNTTFEYNEDDKEWIVSNVCCWDFEKARLNNDEIYIEHRKPIPLTEEILLKCKGTLDGYIYNGWDDMQFFRFDEYNASVFELEIINDEFFYGNNKIEFLHDLQNCYFFHENKKKELTVNL